jgi:hypothetical protein
VASEGFDRMCVCWAFFTYDFRNDEQSNKSPLPVSSTISRRKLMPRDLDAYRVTKSCHTATEKNRFGDNQL